MANAKATLLQDLITAVAGEMSLPTTPLFAQGERGYNERLEQQAERDMPCICYALEQSGIYDIKANEKTYLQYNTLLLFVDFTPDEPEVIQNTMRSMHLVAIEFLQRLQRQPAFDAVADNLFILPPAFTERALLFDAHVSGVQVTLSLKIDPSINTPSC